MKTIPGDNTLIAKAIAISLSHPFGAGSSYFRIGSEKPRSISSVLELLLSLSKEKNIKIKQDPERMRPSDVPILWGDCSKFKRETGWQPEIPFEKTMADLLNYWRERI